MTDSIQVPVGYSFVRIINSGGFGTVVEMIEKSTNIHYAGKIVQCLTQQHKNRFDREVGRLKTFSHPRIIKLKEAVTIDGYNVMVMELGGKSLADVVKDCSERKVLMPRDEVYQVMEDIASALEEMHNRPGGRTAHGDIKMENILMDPDGHAKLCDFGAAESEDVSVSRSVISQLYVSPERMESETGAATCEADVWSLGVVLYWLLFGEPPFPSKNPVHVIRAISSFKATSIKNTCGEEERALLMRMMDPCVETRVTCHQLCSGKAFRCIVDTPAGVWKLKDSDEKALSTRLAEDEFTARLAQAEEEKRMIRREKDKLSDEVKRMKEELGEVRKEKEKSEREKSELFDKIERMRMMMKTEWTGTESLRIFDRTAHTLTPTTLTQIIKLETATWRTAFTLPIDEGEWEFKIRGDSINWIVMLGFLQYPLPEDATQWQCGYYDSGIGGDFILWDGRMWKDVELKPAGTNKKCEKAGQTAAIRVNMSTREAKLFVDDEEQPGIFTDIPSPLCLGITTHYQATSIDVVWLKRI
ncbi:putative Carbon catabolite-derepressing protein kinase [Blattamonas nauphoetae]|uniref:Carbon catabolite-derepressing protein kinase n=1 Tax=Blattamonas nauphoetae TaxID=2049346 RepID=A0ABQ9YI30_9EUKA|nr:putative Carbon catabolite-derepressing protein kinase [Blattamonas nauphoetae]